MATIKYSEPAAYFPNDGGAKASPKKRPAKKPKTRIEDYADRMSSPIGIVRIDPITRKPLKDISGDGD